MATFDEIPNPDSLRRSIRKLLTRVIAATDRQHDANTRYQAIALIIALTGCRASECRNLRVDDLEITPPEVDHRITVHFRTLKRGAPRNVPIIGHDFHFLIRVWIRLRNGRSRAATSPFLFPGRDPSTPVCYRTIHRACVSIFHCRPHLLRHAFGTYVYNQSKDIRLAQTLLGHRSISSTQIYTHVTPSDIRTVCEKYALEVTKPPLKSSSKQKLTPKQSSKESAKSKHRTIPKRRTKTRSRPAGLRRPTALDQ